MRRAFAGLLTAGAVAASIGALAPSAGAAENVLELASPLQSEGFNVTGTGWADGSHAIYKLGLLDINGRYSARTADGSWSRTTLDQVQTKVNTVVLDGADDLSTQIFSEQQMFLNEGAPEGLYVHNPDGSVDALAEWQLADPLGPPEIQRTATYRGRSADARTLYVAATPGVMPMASASGLYRWKDGDVEPVVLDDGRPAACKGGATIGDASGSAYTTLGQTGVSPDGHTIFVTTAACSDGGDAYARHVLVWRDGDSVDLSEPLPGATDYGAEYRGSSRDGDTVYFVSRTKLTEDDDNDVADLFAVNVSTGDFERLTAESAGADDAGVEAATVAPGGTAVWFKTTNPLDGAGETGRGNLFRWTAAGGVEHVLTAPSTNDVNLFPGTISGASEVSWDGSTLAMPSYGDLTDDARGTQPRIYRITADGDIGCLTCADPDATSGSRLTAPPSSTGNADYGVPSVSADGATILFETPAALVPADRNGRVDAYLWRDGEVSLLSTGTQPADSNAAGLSWDGRTAFFTSFGALLPGTTDPYSKLYAARLGQAPPPAPPAPCSGDACQGPSIPPATPPAPLSETFEGAGNVRPAALVTFSPAWPGKGALSTAARRGTLPLTVTGSGAGRISATVQARIGGAWVQVAATGKTMAKGRAQLTLKLSAKARKQLAAGRSLRIRVTVRASRVAGARSATFLLRGTRKATAKRVVRR